MRAVEGGSEEKKVKKVRKNRPSSLPPSPPRLRTRLTYQLVNEQSELREVVRQEERNGRSVVGDMKLEERGVTSV